MPALVRRDLVKPPPPGIYPDLSMAEYLALDALSSSGVKDILSTSVRHARRATQWEKESTEAQERGTAVHMAILQPKEFPVRYGKMLAGDGRSAAVKASKADIVSQGKHPLTATVWEDCERARDAAWAHPEARALLEQCSTEVTYVWELEGASVYGKARADIWAPASGVIADIKTCEDASPEAFGRTAASFRYEVSQPWYLDGARAVGAPMDTWLLLAIECDAPHYEAVLYEVDPLLVESARRQMEVAIETWIRARSANEFPGYPTGVVPLRSPGWLYKEALRG